MIFLETSINWNSPSYVKVRISAKGKKHSPPLFIHRDEYLNINCAKAVEPLAAVMNSDIQAWFYLYNHSFHINTFHFFNPDLH